MKRLVTMASVTLGVTLLASLAWGQSTPSSSGVTAPAIATVTGTNTASLPASQVPRKLIYAESVYTASATAGNRYVTLALVNTAGTVVASWYTSAAVTASQAGYHVEFMPGTYREAAFDASHTIQTPYATGLLIPAGYTLKIYDSAAVSASDSETTYFETVQ